LQAALDMILTGRTVRARRALQIGLVDEMVHPAILRDVAVQRARALADGTLKPSRSRKFRATSLLLEHNPLGRGVVFKKARESVMEKTHGQYPAPLAALEAVQTGYTEGPEAGMRREAQLFGEMAMTDVSRQLVFLFFATNALKKDPGVDGTPPRPRAIERIGVLGAGFMGAGIASVAVQQGTLVRLKDTDTARIGKGLAALRSVVQERLAKRQITRQQFDDYLALIGGTTDYSGFGSADLVIEAVFEDLEVKRRVIAETEAAAPADLIFASNTSTIPIARLAEASRRPENVVGMHFFSPVAKMPLLEVIRQPKTSAVALATAVAAGRRMGKTVIVVNDGPGFFTTRVLAPFLNEASYLLLDGASIEQVDAALTRWGWPVGPFALMDEVGLDIGHHVSQIMVESFGERLLPPPVFACLIAEGRLGRKSGRGFYLYGDGDGNVSKGGGGGKKVDPEVYRLLGRGDATAPTGRIPDREIVERCVFQMLNETARCLAEGIVTEPADVDIGVIFGFGFPPFRGGLLREADRLGLATVVERLEGYAARYGERLSPAPLLREMAQKAQAFYPGG
jgi:3-hydroxyacyl-CoA dehydrogenase/enoyl-CoA hydratase/3-hydroxybutyryl-CoA epimerase